MKETKQFIPVSEFDYELPQELIAQTPSEKRENESTFYGVRPKNL